MGGWIKSLQCRSRVMDDVVHHRRSDPPKHRLHSLSCRSSARTLFDVVDAAQKMKPKKQKMSPQPPQLFTPSVSGKPDDAIPKSGSYFSALAELPEGHPSRNVVEIIFHTGWGEKGFPGRVEMVLKVQNSTRTVDRFEEYRETVKQRASCSAACEDHHSRCAADGNEVMRFYCLGDTAIFVSWGLPGAKIGGVCTYSGSSAAHESAGGGRGRRAMLVCRAVAGRVGNEIGMDSFQGYDSVSGANGELLVLDARGLLPCFLIIYQL